LILRYRRMSSLLSIIHMWYPLRALYSIPVCHPVLSRYLASARRLSSEAPSPVPRCTTAKPFASNPAGPKTCQMFGYPLHLTRFGEYVPCPAHTQNAGEETGLLHSLSGVPGSGKFKLLSEHLGFKSLAP
jgi:hypothetical protein